MAKKELPVTRARQASGRHDNFRVLIWALGALLVLVIVGVVYVTSRPNPELAKPMLTNVNKTPVPPPAAVQ